MITKTNMSSIREASGQKDEISDKVFMRECRITYLLQKILTPIVKHV